jgi:hypothetical protein
MKNKKKSTTTGAGWGFPPESRRAHFFYGSTSLCGTLEGYRGPKDKDMAHTPDDCATCRKMIATIAKLAKAA